MAVSSVKGGSGGRASAVCMITAPPVWLGMAGACLRVIRIFLRESFGTLLRRFTALPEKVQQRTVDYLGVGPGQAVWHALCHSDRAASDTSGQALPYGRRVASVHA